MMYNYHRQPTHDTAAAALADALGLSNSDCSDDPPVPERVADESADFKSIDACLERPVPKFPGLGVFATSEFRQS